MAKDNTKGRESGTVRQPYTFDRVARIIFTVCVIIAVIYLLDILKGVLLPFLVACLISYILEPVVQWNMRWTRLKSRFVPVIMTLLEATFWVAGACVLFIPYIVSECSDMASMITAYSQRRIEVPYISEGIHEFVRSNFDFNDLVKLLSKDEWQALLKEAIMSSWTFLTSGLALIVSILSWFVVVLYVLFIMLDYERLMLSFRQLVPHAHRKKVNRVVADIKNAMNSYFRGQCLVATLVGVLFSIGFLIIGLPMAVVFGLFIGVLNLIPYFQILSLPIAGLLCLVWTVNTGESYWVIFWETMAVYVVVQCIQDFFLVPKIMGKAMGLNPAIILLALSVWGSLLGFIGLIVALPLTTLLLSYYNLYVIEKSSID